MIEGEKRKETIKMKRLRLVLVALLTAALLVLPMMAYADEYSVDDTTGNYEETGGAATTPGNVSGTAPAGEGQYSGIMPFAVHNASNLVELQDLINTPPAGITGINLTTNILIPAGTTVTISTNLPITAEFGGFTVNPGATFNLTDTTLQGGTGIGVDVNGGIFNKANSTISNFDSRGVMVRANSTFNMTGGTISGNSILPADGWGGAGVRVNGVNANFNMISGTISGNNSGSQHGAGVLVQNGGSFVMDNGVIRENITSARGGGVHVVNANSTATMNGGIIELNQANTGGGVNAEGGATFNMNGGEIRYHNLPGTAHGGGVNVNGILNMRGGIIHNNQAHNGGGVWVAGPFNMYTAGELPPRIENNTARAAGGGVYVLRGDFTMDTGIISGNKANNGGGVFLTSYPAAYATNFIMKEGLVDNNTATAHGGGILVIGANASVEIQSGAISNNIAQNGNGGGIALRRSGLDGASPNLDITGQSLVITGGSISNNTAVNGGGIGFVVYPGLDYEDYEDVIFQYLVNVVIGPEVNMADNEATNGSRPNEDLYAGKTNINHLDRSVLSEPYDYVGRFTNHDIHTPRQARIATPTITKAVTPALPQTVAPGGTVTYRITVNTDEMDPTAFMDGVRVSDVLDGRLTFNPNSVGVTGVVGGSGGFAYDFDATSRTLEVYNMVLSPGSTQVVITFTATVPANVSIPSNVQHIDISNTAKLTIGFGTDAEETIRSNTVNVRVLRAQGENGQNNNNNIINGAPKTGDFTPLLFLFSGVLFSLSAVLGGTSLKKKLRK